ncbi:hypothetical protein P280DRAFT_128068 [Massarina eburnea CBS 473.64]|uniref:Uncharacterized protein n=1 Tax=Massarina eburnea CBS 473.64 TaxID=1395130 RepID=A0A6A6SH03_9PLEO|nr:hypothetical protein P280DRAFT_128068 [Massarina eburnea CBS 473.64]
MWCALALPPRRGRHLMRSCPPTKKRKACALHAGVRLPNTHHRQHPSPLIYIRTTPPPSCQNHVSTLEELDATWAEHCTLLCHGLGFRFGFRFGFGIDTKNYGLEPTRRTRPQRLRTDGPPNDIRDTAPSQSISTPRHRNPRAASTRRGLSLQGHTPCNVVPHCQNHNPTAPMLCNTVESHDQVPAVSRHDEPHASIMQLSAP